MTIYISSYSKYGAALYIGCWSCTNYGVARAASAVWLSPPMMMMMLCKRHLSVDNFVNKKQLLFKFFYVLASLHEVQARRLRNINDRTTPTNSTITTTVCSQRMSLCNFT